MFFLVLHAYKCSESGSVWFWASWILIRNYLSWSGSIHQQAKKVRKTSISTILWLIFDFFFFEEWCSVPSKSRKHKNLFKDFCCCLHLVSHRRKKQDADPLVSGTVPTYPRIRIRSKVPRIHNTNAFFMKIIDSSPKSLAGHRYPRISEKSRTVFAMLPTATTPPPPTPQ